MRSIHPVKYYSDEGFVEHKIEIGDEDLEEIIRAVSGTACRFRLRRGGGGEQPPDGHLALCRVPEIRGLGRRPAAKQEAERRVSAGAEVKVYGRNDGNPTGR